MGPDPHPDSPENGARPGQDSGRADENQAGAWAQFAAGQRFDTEKAGLPLAAAPAEVQAELRSLDDDELAGFLGGCQKIAAWSTAMLLDGIAEFARRRPDDATPGRAVLYAAAVNKARPALLHHHSRQLLGLAGRARTWAVCPPMSRSPVLCRHGLRRGNYDGEGDARCLAARAS